MSSNKLLHPPHSGGGVLLDGVAVVVVVCYLMWWCVTSCASQYLFDGHEGEILNSVECFGGPKPAFIAGVEERHIRYIVPRKQWAHRAGITAYKSTKTQPSKHRLRKLRYIKKNNNIHQKPILLP